ncbi:DUF6069 family protein [Paractinoplanes rishiriensis]|uniref:Uncharacterized protein n=1 Tax=Paractinoplanes rishiriensis TaxID=1050105 RepID=A0A919KAB2_9ACTN|nr:DUF6069 family protein [Actinoplanes rishiriensis]GIF01653.1 hypothetical protein Ari01nite_91170 [Actinoplanes rishiriensis]
MTATRTDIAAATVATTKTAIGPLLRDGVLATVLAGGAAMVVAWAGRAAGISLDVQGAPIPLTGFATATAMCSVVGILLAVVLAKVARHPRRAFVRATVALTVLSLVPDVLITAAPATRALLMVTHLVAAAIIIPAVARRLEP